MRLGLFYGSPSNDGHVADLLEEFGAYLEGHLGILDAVSISLIAEKSKKLH